MCRGRGGKTTINRAYYFSNEYLKTVKDEPIEGCVNNIQIKKNTRFNYNLSFMIWLRILTVIFTN